ncbi:hypothetical protein BT63DRAFT_468086, partial [Microthyrium microscopicum]
LKCLRCGCNRQHRYWWSRQVLVSYSILLGLGSICGFSLLLLQLRDLRHAKKRRLAEDQNESSVELKTMNEILVQFYEVQCYFIAVIQIIGTLVVVQNVTRVSGSTNGLQTSSSFHFMQTIGPMGLGLCAFVGSILVFSDHRRNNLGPNSWCPPNSSQAFGSLTRPSLMIKSSVIAAERKPKAPGKIGMNGSEWMSLGRAISCASSSKEESKVVSLNSDDYTESGESLNGSTLHHSQEDAGGRV